MRATRAPSPRELEQWYPLLMAALDAADVEYVLLHGHQAVHAWRPDLTVETVSRQHAQFMWNNRWLVSAVHHASYITRERDVVIEKQWKEGVAQFAYRAINGIVWDGFARGCVMPGSGGAGTVCMAGFYGWDEDGVAMCQKHYRAEFGKAEAARKRGREIIGKHYQGGMV